MNGTCRAWIGWTCLVAAAFWFAGSAATAGDESPEQRLEQMSLEDLLGIEVTSAAKIAQRASDAPSDVSVITRDEIQSYGWVSLNDVLGKQPGFSPSMDYDRRTVTARGAFEGWNNNHLLLLVDGVPHNDDLYGSAYTSEITPLFIAKSLEIIRGPGSALYGSNATNGVITVHTLSASDLTGPGEAQVRVGDFGSQIYDAVAGAQSSAASMLVAYDGFRTNGNGYADYDGSGRADADGSLERFHTRDDRSSDYVFGKITGDGALRGLELQAHWQSWDFQTGHGWLWYVPDFPESMHEARRLLSLSYAPEGSSWLSQEYVVRYQHHDIDWHQRYYPNGAVAGDITYPAGVWEDLRTGADDVFARAQHRYALPLDASLIAGLESTVFWYGGDQAHFSNANLDGDYAPFPDNLMHPVGPWLDWLKGHPILNLGPFAQLSSGKVLGDQLVATLGLRYDRESFDFTEIDDPDRPTHSKRFAELSPRLGLVYEATPDLTLKLLAGRAFRAPTPTELGGAHTLSLASNIRQLRPETVTTAELADDWRITESFDWRSNLFFTKLDDQIGYSVSNLNLSTNLYSLTTAGVESEVLVGLGPVTGFLNYSFAQRLDESIDDPTISVDPHRVTWAPAHTANLGADWKPDRFDLSLQAHYQGPVARRGSDRLNPLFVPYRPGEVGDWVTLDGRAAVRLFDHIDAGLLVTNLLDTRSNRLIKNFDYPFDYQQEGRRIYVTLRAAL